MASNPMRELPSVDRLLAHQAVASLDLPQEVRTSICRTAIDGAREAVRKGGAAPSLDELAAWVASGARALLAPRPRRVINATGVIIHTNLGRAPLSLEALEALRAVALGYSDLEFDMEEGGAGLPP